MTGRDGGAAPAGMPEVIDGAGAVAPSAADPAAFIAAIPIDQPMLDAGGRLVVIDPAGCELGLYASGRAPVLIDHLRYLDSLAGVITGAWLEGATLAVSFRLAPTPRGQELAALIRAGILTGCSMGARCCEPDAEGRVATWRPHELSLVALPALWHSRIMRGPLPREVIENRAAEIAARASGTRETWQGFPARAAPALAASLGVTAGAAESALRAHVGAELERHAAEALLSARQSFGLG